MPRVRINEGDLVSGTGVEGGRKKKRDEGPTPAPEKPAEKEPAPAKGEANTKKPRQGRPLFGDADGADIFYTRK